MSWYGVFNQNGCGRIMKISAAMPDGQSNGEGVLSSALSPQHDSTTGTRELAIAMVIGLTLWIAVAFIALVPLYRALVVMV